MSQDTARPTPYELVFGADAIDDRLFPPIAEEAEARRLPLDDPDRFLFLGSVGQLLRSIAGGEANEQAAAYAAGDPDGERPGPGEGGREGPGEELRQYGRLLYHAFHFWRSGKRLLVLERDAARWLIDDLAAAGDWVLSPPAPHGYLQLPRTLFWASPAPGMKPEPADGFFWSFREPDDAPPSLDVLVALGVRPDRPGFSVVTAGGRLDDVDHWVEVDGRGDGTDFESTLPGGELDRLYSLETAAEVLKLASRCFWLVSRHPEQLGAQETASGGEESTALPFRRILAR